MLFYITAGVLLAVAVGLIWFMNKKQKGMKKDSSSAPMPSQQPMPEEPQAPAPPQEPQNPAQ